MLTVVVLCVTIQYMICSMSFGMSLASCLDSVKSSLVDTSFVCYDLLLLLYCSCIGSRYCMYMDMRRNLNF